MLTAAVNRCIKKVSQDLEKLSFNTAIAAMMQLVNELYKAKAEQGIVKSDGWKFALETLTQLIAPFAPHFAEELWYELGQEASVHISKWPAWDESLITEDTITIAVQVNGKVRAEIDIAADASEEQALNSAKAQDHIAELIKDKQIKKAIYVPGRLVSLVVE